MRSQADRTAATHEGDEVFALAAVLLLALAVGVGILASRHGDLATTKVSGLEVLFQTLSAAFAGVVFVLCVLRWRATGETAVLWTGIAMLTFGVVVIGAADLVLPLLSVPERLGALLPATYAAGFLGVLAALGVALVAPPIDLRVRPRWAVLGSLAGVGVAVACLDRWPAATSMLTGERVTTGLGSHPRATVWLCVPLALAGVVFLLRGLRSQPLLSWIGMAVLGLTLAELTGGLSRRQTQLWGPGGEGLRAVGLLLLVCGSTLELDRANRTQGGRLVESEVATRAAESGARSLQTSMDRHRHDLANALMAIDAAVYTLEQHPAVLDETARAEVARTLRRQIDRLQVVFDQAGGTLSTFFLANAVRSAAQSAQIDGRAQVGPLSDVTLVADEGRVVEAIREVILLADAEACGQALTLYAGTTDEGAFVDVVVPGRGASRRRGLSARGSAGTRTWSAPNPDVLAVAQGILRTSGATLAIEPIEPGDARAGRAGMVRFRILLPQLREQAGGAL